MKDGSLKSRVLYAAMAEFAEKGYFGASLGEVAKRCGTSSALVCYHFKTKELLAKAVIDEIRATIKTPKAAKAEEIPSALAYRAALKTFIDDFLVAFLTDEEPGCYVSGLYRQESAHPTAKADSLHDTVLRPVFNEFEKLIALGVPERDPVTVRYWALAMWNVLLGFALKDRMRVGAYMPEGMSPDVFRRTAVEFLVDDLLAPLKYNPQ